MHAAALLIEKKKFTILIDWWVSERVLYLKNRLCGGVSAEWSTLSYYLHLFILYHFDNCSMSILWANFAEIGGIVFIRRWVSSFTWKLFINFLLIIATIHLRAVHTLFHPCIRKWRDKSSAGWREWRRNGNIVIHYAHNASQQVY